MSSPDIGFERYRPLGRRARWARVALVTMIAADVIAVLSGLREYVLLERLETELVTAEELEASDRRQQVVAFSQLAVYAFAAIFFIRWLHRAYANIVPLGAQYPRYSTGTAIWSWFVPILNLWRPKQVINDVWRASDPEAPVDQGDTWQQKDPPLLYGVWWTAWVLLTLAYNADFRIYLRAETLDELQFSSLFTVVTDGASVLAALLAIAVVHRTTDRHEARAAQLRQTVAAGPAEGESGILTPPNERRRPEGDQVR
ncbi:MAG: DUF4328 domain-containing protein [Gaiellaceae bacterium]